MAVRNIIFKPKQSERCRKYSAFDATFEGSATHPVHLSTPNRLILATANRGQVGIRAGQQMRGHGGRANPHTAELGHFENLVVSPHAG